MRKLFLLLAFSLPLISSAQHRTVANEVPTWRIQTELASNSFDRHLAQSDLALASGQKSVGLAVLLGLYVPGLGSLYAGNTTHFVRHFGLMLLAIPAGAASFLIGPPALYAVIFGYVANYVWSIATAVQDVNAHNLQVSTASNTNAGVTLLRLRL